MIFIVAFYLNAMLAVCGIFLSIFITIPADFTHRKYPELAITIKAIVLDFSLFIAVLCATILVIFDLVLLKAICKKHYNNLLVLGESIGQHLGG